MDQIATTARRLICLLALASAALTLAAWAAVDTARAQWEIVGFDGEVLDENGDPAQMAGSHPHVARTVITLPTETNMIGGQVPLEAIKDTIVELPPGLVGNPEALGICTDFELNGAGVSADGQCPANSQAGVARLQYTIGWPFKFEAWEPIFRMNTRAGAPAVFGMNVSGAAVKIVAEVRSGGDYGITAMSTNITQILPLDEIDVRFWGVPADPSHDPIRGECMELTTGVPTGGPGCPMASDFPPIPFLTLPTSCVGPVDTLLTATTWEGSQDTASFTSHDNGMPPNPIGVEGCENVPFSPKASIKADATTPGTPTGMAFRLQVPQDGLLAKGGIASSHLRRAVVELPEGMVVNPASADGLKGCSPAQIALGASAPARCPDGSTIGTIRIDTPLLDHTLVGSVYVAEQSSFEDSLIALYLSVDDEETGLVVKLPGKVEPDPFSGRLRATFDNQPQLPFTELVLRLKSGPRAPLVTPTECGVHEARAEFEGWAGNPPVELTDRITVKAGQQIGCGQSFDPELAAGSENPQAGERSAYSLVVSRSDGDAEISSISQIQLPDGLLGDVGSVPLCPDAAADAGACPEASRVGRVEAALGAGASPLWIPQAGKSPTAVYLAGPYGGAPYSLSVVVPAQAGPFDLGRVVVRSALHVDERTARITAGVDETRIIGRDGSVRQVLAGKLPRILEGIVLNQREIRVIADRPGFMVNPTGCAQRATTARISSYAGGQADRTSRFRATDCARLGFAPRLTARILDRGRKSTLKSWHPRIKFTLTSRPGDANIGGARVVLPSSTILDQSNIGTTCTRAQLADRACPERSLVGYAKAWTPLLRRPIEGPVYLTANGGARPLPDLTAMLDGEIRISLTGWISTQRGGGKARLQNTFNVVPDAPVNRFELTMRGGRDTGLLVNSTDLCRSRESGAAVFVGHNAKRSRRALRLAPSFKGCAKVRVGAKRAARKAARKAGRAMR